MPPSIPESTHKTYLRQCIQLATLSPPKPTNFRVGSVLVSFPDPSSDNDTTTTSSDPPTGTVLSTGYTLELPGNTHAEQNALAKLANPTATTTTTSSSSDSPLPAGLNATLYTSLEPCSHRLSGSTACVDGIIATRQSDPKGGIRKVVFGAKEPGTFVKDSQSCRMLSEAGVEWEFVGGMEAEILGVAMAGHETRDAPRNPKKRMMELDTSGAGGGEGV